ncbi:POSTN [Cordylochernes scorpioides]|uniref:POSTN n=1 Tax=Cordylochernes scorpioides TaxID=51811 RepID=A0ABY6KA30_9ARAC|nr:POSTN [Cordylochernes scorpioides]
MEDDCVSLNPAAISNTKVETSDFQSKRCSLKNLLAINQAPFGAEIVGTHIVDQPICASAVTEPHSVSTLGGATVNLSCNSSGVFFGGSQVVNSEVLLGSNGMAHTLMDVVITHRGESLSSQSLLELVLRRPDLTVFASLLGASRLEGALDDATVFAPSDAAFKQLPAATLEALTPGGSARRLLLEHHLVPRRQLRTSGLADNLRVPTLTGPQDLLRLKVYRNGVGVGTAIIQTADLEAYNGVLHILDKVLVPSVLPVTESLTEEYSMFAEALRRVEEADPGFLGSGANNSVTVFAPSNSAFRRWGISRIDSLLENIGALRVLVKNHVVGNMLPAGSFSGQYSYQVWTESAQHVTVSWHEQRLQVGGASVLEADIPAAEGVVHCIDTVLLEAPYH